MRIKIDDDVLEEIRQKSDIVTIISEYIPLKNTGKNYQGLCPFHHEKTPSFSVNREKQLFHCFGCKVGGNVFNFIMQIEKSDFIGAVQILAQKAGVVIDREAKSEKDVYYDANLWANRYYHYLLCQSKVGQPARAYLAKRGIGMEMIKKFRLGYAPNSWNDLLNALEKKKVLPTLLEQVGLVIAKKNGGYYDRFRHRLMFPILDRYGKVIAFGGRVLDDSLPKYLNSPETVLFSKSRNLYGLQAAHHKMRELKQVLIVEGYFDFISLYQAGIEHVVASLGTALTVDHAKILGGLVEEVIMAYDADTAGVQATLRSMEILAAQGLAVRVLTWPSGYDPDAYVQEKGVEAVKALVQKAIPWLDYRFQQIFADYQTFDVEEKKEASSRCLALITKMRNQIERDEYLRLIAEKIGVREDSLRQELRFMEKNNNKGKEKNKEEKKRDTNHDYRILSPAQKAEQTLLTVLLKNRSLAEWAANKIEPDDFLNEIHKRIFLFIRELINNKVDIEWAESLHLIEDEQLKAAILSFLLEELPDNHVAEKITMDCFYVLKKYRLNQLIAEKQQEIKQAEKRGESTRVLLTDYQNLLHEKKNYENRIFG